MFYVIAGPCGWYILIAQGLFLCKISEIVSGPYTFAQAARNFICKRDVEHDIQLGQRDYCARCGEFPEQCHC